MKLIKSLAIVGVITALFASCTEVYPAYVPAEPETGSQFYFSKDLNTSITLTPTSTAIEVEICRGNAAEAATAVIKATDTTKVFVAAVDTTINVAFAAEAKSAVLSIPVKMAKIDFGDKFYIDVKITDEATQYGIAETTLVVELPEPWKSLGTTGKFYDGFFMDDPLENIEIQQNELYPNQFRLVKPYAKAPAVGGLSQPGNDSDYINFRILQPGVDDLWGEPVTQSDLVFFEAYYTGYFHDSYGDDIKVYHPAYFTNTGTEASWLHNKVLSYQSDEPGALPAQVQFGPRYYMDSVGGWNYSQYDDMIIITFPGVVLKDYSIETSFEGILSSKEGDYALVDVALGEDVEGALVAIAPGKDPQAALNLILAEDESVISIDASGSVKIPLATPDEYYSYVAVSVGDNDLQELDYATIAYKDFSIKIVDNGAVTVSETLAKAKFNVTLGKDVEFAKVAFVAGENANDALALVLADDESVVTIKSSEEVVFDIPGAVEGLYTAVAVSYAYDQAWNTKAATLEYGPWTSLGTGLYGDSFTYSSKYLATLADGVHAPVEIFKNEEDPALFKIVGAYDGYLSYYGGEADPNLGATTSFKITIMKAGDKPNPNGEAVAEDGAVYWDLFPTEIYDVDQDIFPLHPSTFTSLATAENYALSHVESYQESGLPAIITLDPYWYVLNVKTGAGVGGWGFGSPITIIFPGVSAPAAAPAVKKHNHSFSVVNSELKPLDEMKQSGEYVVIAHGHHLPLAQVELNKE